jgi:phospholipase C
MVYDEWGGFFDHVAPPRVPDLRASRKVANDFGQMGFRIPAVVVSPYARRGHVDHSVYGFESILKMIRYRYGRPPLTPRDLYANNIAAAFDFESKPDYAIPDLPTPPEVIVAPCAGTLPDTGGAGIDDGLLGVPPGTVPTLPVPTLPVPPLPASGVLPHREPAEMLSSGYLERLGFKYRPATPATMYSHPSKLGMRS